MIDHVYEKSNKSMLFICKRGIGLNHEELVKVLGSILEEVRTKNELESSPIITASFSTSGPVYVDLLLKNIGNAAAIDVSIEFLLKLGKYKKSYQTLSWLQMRKLNFSYLTEV